LEWYAFHSGFVDNCMDRRDNLVKRVLQKFKFKFKFNAQVSSAYTLLILWSYRFSNKRMILLASYVYYLRRFDHNLPSSRNLLLWYSTSSISWPAFFIRFIFVRSITTLAIQYACVYVNQLSSKRINYFSC
jgi:hypothetical protein